MTIYYTKQGRRYVPAANGQPWHHDHDVMTVGQSRLATVVASGERTYQYGVTPECAGIAAALAMLRHDLTHQIRLMAIGQPVNPWREYTPEQQALIEEFQERMAETGGLFPSSWTVQSPSDIATAICNLLAEHSMHTNNDSTAVENMPGRYTNNELRAKIASNDYGAELCLQHAMANIGVLEAALDARAKEINRLMTICQTAHDRLLRGDQDAELLAILEAAWKDRPTDGTSR